ncbi:NAD(P)-dependent oxidoreductase [Brenneria goodwinii]|uniref:NAD(P)-dependent oxidoreductase n=1 Tax=Brenneria goodwinii TaxID=1109412 RepID=UPI000EF213A3|nr:NAD(P)-dependent oxidoreductase [Brenneria goodwinii]MCG8157250.1 NAD(P)-dependent oxidoreductase [Brenneria goodwinii]MCG8162204.1 NAD(P)-dependent oxidoreductase [Brenneria goodwinii]MCG8166134.1 NAD(P)-dependent oxidoreductase [Brenneria goodwinii]MCG8170761.1 NAD(P)-dependent oxidoreductase [Brenneria goodwinii]MCG8175830.1 NAD(P)-dependent oxidoreductase [Brenneria goodwinii]
MSQKPVVAVLGLGAMGHAFASNLLKNDFIVRGWNRTRVRGEDLQDNGLILCSDAVQAVEGADVIITMLADGEMTHRVLNGVLQALKQGSILCQMGTIGVESTDNLKARLAQVRSDILFIDAPVSGTKAPAEKGQILVLASGNRSRAQKAEQVFSAISKGQLWLGEAGAGSRMKLVINSWLIGLMQSLVETTLLSEKFGFSTADLWRVLDGGPLAVPYAKTKLDMIASGDFTPQMHLVWALKDGCLAVEAIGNARLPALENIISLWERAVEAGYGEQDLAAVYKYLKSS